VHLFLSNMFLFFFLSIFSLQKKFGEEDVEFFFFLFIAL
jgi:hypothetical protein